MNTIKECFNIILYGNEADSRLAAASGREKYEDIVAVVNTSPDSYEKISEGWRQENFVMAVSVIYFLHDRETQPDFLVPWLFQLLQHPNGYIRYAAVKMISNEIGPLTYHLRFPGEKLSFRETIPKDADMVLYSLFASLNGLLVSLWQTKYKKYKYINLLPPSPYKSVQMVLAELEDCCGKKYIDRLVYLTKPF